MIFNDNVVENAASALAQLLQNKLDTVGYDKTMVYTIVDDSQKEKGCYKVTDGSITFEAYSDVTNYKKDEKIYITIPQGDFREKKVILGKYIEAEEALKDIGYISPEDRIVPIYEQKIETNGTLSLYGDEENSDLVWGSHIQLSPNNDWKFIENTLSRLVVSCEIQSSLSNYNVISGEYGLKLILLSSQEGTTNFKWNPAESAELNIELAKNQGLIVNYLEFSSKDMIGNVYNYKGSIHQSKIFNISNVGNIFYCVPLFYYKKNFKSLTLTGEKDLEECLKDHPSELAIEFQNLSLTFGFDQTEFDQEDNLIIFNDPRINAQFNSKESVNKSLYGYNIVLNSKNGKFENYTNFSQNEYLYWYEDSFVNNDNRGGKGWQQIESQFNKKLSLANFTISSKEVKKSYKAVKVIIDDETKSEVNISSNIVEYANADYGENASGLVWLEILDEQKDYKNLYGENYAIINFEDFQKIRTIKASIPETRTFNQIKIEWWIPRGSSMILDVYDNIDSGAINSKYLALCPQNESTTYNYTDDYYVITKSYTGAEVLDLSFFKLSFGIKQIYQPTFNRNQIICKVFYNNDQSYCDEGRIDLSFGRLNNSGTAYDFGIFFSNPNKPYLIGNKENDEVFIYCTLSSSKISLSEEEIDTCLTTCKFSSLNGDLLVASDNSEPDKAVVSQKTAGRSDIIVASIIVKGAVIQAYLPIPLAYESGANYTNGIQGNCYAYYDSYGSLIKTEQFPLKAYGQLDNISSGDITITTANPVTDSLTFEPKGCVTIPTSTQYMSTAHEKKGTLLLDIGKRDRDGKELYQAFKYKFSGEALTINTVYYLKAIVKNDTHIQKILIGTNNELYYLDKIKGDQDSGGAIKHSVYSDENCTTQIIGDFEVNWSADRIASKHFLVSPAQEASKNYSFVYLPNDGIYSINYNCQELRNGWADYEVQRKYGVWYIYTLEPTNSNCQMFKDIVKWNNILVPVFLNPQDLTEANVYNSLTDFAKEQVAKIRESTYDNYYLQIYDSSGNSLGQAKFNKDNGLEYNKNIVATIGYVAMYNFEFDSKTIPSGGSLPVDWRITSNESEDKKSDIGKPVIISQQDSKSNIKSSFVQYYPMYITNNNAQYYLEAYIVGENGSVATTCWQQPLLIQQNNYEFEILNNWNGQTEITDVSIMSPCIGAGSKNENNQFSGVLMGKISKSAEDKIPIHGLYGFSKGAQAFGFKEDGTAFIGKSDAGRINFNGTNGTITSLGYENGLTLEQVQKFDSDATEGWAQTGIKIDLDDPSLDMKYKGKSILEFIPKDNKMNLSSPEDGMSIDLINGEIKSNKFKLTAGRVLNSNGLYNGIEISSELASQSAVKAGWFGENSQISRPYIYPNVELGWQGNIKANYQSINNITISNSLIEFDQNYSPLFTVTEGSDLGDSNLGKVEFDRTYEYHEQAHLLSFGLTNSNGLKEYYELYLNMVSQVVIVYNSDKSQKKEGTTVYFYFDIRPNFSKQSDEMSYLNGLGSKQFLNKDYALPIDKWEMSKVTINSTILELLNGIFGENKFESKKTYEFVNSEDKIISFGNNYTICEIEYKETPARYFTIAKDKKSITLQQYRLSGDWVIMRNGENSQEATNYLTALSTFILGVNQYETRFKLEQPQSLGGRFIDIGVLTSTDDTWKATRQRHEFFVDAMGTTHISDLKLPKPYSGNRTDVISYITLHDYIKEVLRNYKLIT